MTAPTVVGVGAVSTPTQASPHAIPYPSGIQAGDIILCIMEAGGGTDSAGWTSTNFTELVRRFEAAATGQTILEVHAKIATGSETGSEDFTITTGTVNHVAGQMMLIRGHGASTTGDIVVGTATGAAAGGSDPQTCGSIGGITIGVDGLVCIVGSSALDASSTTQFGAWTNSDLSSITEQMDFNHLTGNGGGFGLATGVATAATVGTASFQETTNEAWNGVQVGIPAAVPPTGDLFAFVGWVNTGVANVIGGTGSGSAYGQSFAVGNEYTLLEVRTDMYRFGSPTDNLTLEIVESNITSGTVLGSDTIAATSIAATASPGEWVPWDVGSISLSPGTTYFMRVTRSGSADGANSVAWHTNNQIVYPPGDSYRINASSVWEVWSSTSDFTFQLYGTWIPDTTAPEILRLSSSGMRW